MYFSEQCDNFRFSFIVSPFLRQVNRKVGKLLDLFEKTLGFSPLPLGELILLGPDNLVLSLHVDGPPALLADHGDDLL